MVRAKFYVTERTEYAGGNGVTIKMRAVYSDDPQSENKKFWEATPSAELTMFIKTNAADVFTPGREFYLDFTVVPPAIADDGKSGNTVAVPGLAEA
jgi:hypothetical protein